MGNTPSIKIQCLVERMSHVPGETIRGMVTVKVEHCPEPLDDYDGITVTLAGHEVYLDPQAKKGYTLGNHIHVRQTFNFYKGKLPEGYHEFPFELELPYPDELYAEEQEQEDQQHCNTVDLAQHIGHIQTTTTTTTTTNSCTSSNNECSSPASSRPSLMSTTSGMSTSTSISYNDDGYYDYDDDDDWEYDDDEDERHELNMQISYRIRATIRRKKHIPRMIDNDHWANAELGKIPDYYHQYHHEQHQQRQQQQQQLNRMLSSSSSPSSPHEGLLL